MQHYLKFLVLTLLCFSQLNIVALADGERWYDVELLVFKHAKAEHFLTEQWPTSWTIPNVDNSLDPLNISQNFKKYFDKMNRDELTLAGAFKALEDSSRYQVLAYRNWKQVGLNKEQAINVRINAGQKYLKLPNNTAFSNRTLTINTTEIKTGALFEPVLDTEGTVIRYRIPQYSLAADDTQPEDIVYQLDGNIKIILSRFLHIYADLLLMEPVKLTQEKSPSNNVNESTGTGIIEETRSNLDITETQKTITPNTYKLSLASANDYTTLHGFNIKDHRRMRSGELHHLDHPLLGIMIKISPSKISGAQ